MAKINGKTVDHSLVLLLNEGKYPANFSQIQRSMTDIWPKNLQFEHFEPILSLNEPTLENLDFLEKNGLDHF